MTPPSLQVWEQITAAFPPALPAQPITTCDCDECRDVQANLGHLRWNEVLPPAINKHFGSLPLLTDDAFHVLLPAFLFQALSDISSENKFLEWTLYALSVPYEENETATKDPDAQIRKRITSFTAPQRAAIRAFLRLVATTPDLASHHDAIAHAHSAIWV